MPITEVASDIIEQCRLAAERPIASADAFRFMLIFHECMKPIEKYYDGSRWKFRSLLVKFCIPHDHVSKFKRFI